ncbi:MAG TPA: UbiA family prenyltransferase [Verrucomicrobiae bacterium]|nr:UbiA family prenyltransferase [Verrucomicrobiae bacterium]
MNRTFRTLLILGRVSNLPTVWSNCLAGWWLSGGGNVWKLPLLLLGTSFLYVSGMFLNDAFDAEFDRQRRVNRPIPSGAISLDAVWRFGWAWMVLGVLCLLLLGKIAAALAVALAVSILIYNAAHKYITASPWLMGLCRFWVYVIAGTTGADGLNGWPVWCGVALAFYIVGLSYVARRESFRGPIPYWPLIFLAAPVLWAMVMNAGEYRVPAIWLSLILILWIAFCTRQIFQAGEINVGRVVSGLLAGIVFVDWLAVAPVSPEGLNFAFLILFGTAILLQRFVPAT